MVPRWGSGRLVRHKNGQVASWEASWAVLGSFLGRLGRPLGVMLGLMLGSCWHLFSWWVFDAVRTSFWTPTWSEIDAKIEPKTFPKTFKFRTWKSVPKIIENKLDFDRKIIDFLTWFLVIFQCVACRVFALVGMIGCLKNMQKQRFWNDFRKSTILLEHEIVFEIKYIFDHFWHRSPNPKLGRLGEGLGLDFGLDFRPCWGPKQRPSGIKKSSRKKMPTWAQHELQHDPKRPPKTASWIGAAVGVLVQVRPLTALMPNKPSWTPFWHHVGNFVDRFLTVVGSN